MQRHRFGKAHEVMLPTTILSPKVTTRRRGEKSHPHIQLPFSCYFFKEKTVVIASKASLSCSKGMKNNQQVALPLAIVAVFVIGAFALFSNYPCLFLCSSEVYDEPEPIPQRMYEERVEYVETNIQKGRKYFPMNDTAFEYNVFDCPMEPPLHYPREFPIMDVLNHWPTSDTDLSANTRYIHQGICVFDFALHDDAKVRAQIRAYQEKEKPFVVKNDPHALKTVERWNTGNYLHYKLQRKVFQGEFTKSLSMMYWATSGAHKIPKNFKPPTQKRPTTFEKWFKRAMDLEGGSPRSVGSDVEENSYLRIDGCLSHTTRCHAVHRTRGALGVGPYYFTRLDDGDFLHEDLPFFSPRYYAQGISKDYLIEPEKSRGIQCRFGAKGLIAEDHFDNERNFITVLSGERRYILGHPNNCRDMSLYPMAHPFERHSQVNWSNPDLSKFPNFERVHVNEIVLQAGDILYLPTFWFHHIVSLNLNYQCNTRSGHSLDYDQEIFDCGFLYPWPS